mgnify:CR=1 FL=1
MTIVNRKQEKSDQNPNNPANEKPPKQSKTVTIDDAKNEEKVYR